MKWHIQNVQSSVTLRFDRVDKRADLVGSFGFIANGREFRVTDQLDTDGASIPQGLMTWFGDRYDMANLVPGIPHDAAYVSCVMIRTDKEGEAYMGDWQYVYLAPDEADDMFLAIRQFVGGAWLKNWSMWAGIRLNSTLFELFRKERSYPTYESFLELRKDGIRLSEALSAK